MKLKSRVEPAHREWYLTCDSPRGRMDWYDGCVYRSEKSAQKAADAFNARRNIAKAGKITVAYQDRPEAVVQYFNIQF